MLAGGFDLVETVTLPSGKISSLFGELERNEKILRRLFVAGLMRNCWGRVARRV
jgi:hypothetical protein